MQQQNTLKMFIKLNNYLKIINDNYIYAYLRHKNIEIIKLL